MALINQGINPQAYGALPEQDKLDILATSEADNELDDLKAQRTQANLLMKGGTTYQPKAPSHPVGGAAFALAQGLEGYMGGRDIAKNREEMGALRNRNIEANRKYLDALFAKKEPSPFEGGGMTREEEEAYGAGASPSMDPDIPLGDSGY